MRYEAIRKMSEEEIPTRVACSVSGVSPSSYYSWRRRPVSERSLEDEGLKAKILHIHRESRGTYGEPRLRRSLLKMGVSCEKSRLGRLMKEAGVCGVGKRRFRVQTTDSKHGLPIAPRLFQTENPQTLPTRPNEVWGSDITYIPTQEGWVFLAVFLDLFTRKVVGYATADQMKTELVLNALNQALLGQKPEGRELIAHSDRGSQYASQVFRERLDLLGIQASMSRKGNCYDNAYVESFFHTLKTELIYQREYVTRKEAMSDIFEYIECWYNKHRLHSSIGYQSPIDYEQQSLAA